MEWREEPERKCWSFSRTERCISTVKRRKDTSGCGPSSWESGLRIPDSVVGCGRGTLGLCSVPACVSHIPERSRVAPMFKYELFLFILILWGLVMCMCL